MKNKNIILGIETSCDDTAAAILKNGHSVLSNIVSTQEELHTEFGGIVPEIASRRHVEIINIVIAQALKKTNINFKDLTAVGVTCGPGLIGSLLIGIASAKAISYSLKIPLIGVNHVLSHIYANFIENPDIKRPIISLVASGGHTSIYLLKENDEFEILGSTLDDAAGEVLDKIARFLNLGYPGGPAIEKISINGNPDSYKLPRPMLDKGFNFSFSGLKTAVIYMVRKDQSLLSEEKLTDLAASFQKAVIDVLVEKTIRAAISYEIPIITLAGGVSSNSYLRSEMKERAKLRGIKVIYPPKKYCTDNAAMVACLAYYKLKRGQISNMEIDAYSRI